MIRQIFLIFALTFSSNAFALDASYGVTFDGRAYSDTASTVPMLDVISTKIQVLSPSQTCILYEETQSVDTTATSGYFTVQIGSATADGKRSSGDSGNNMRTVFANSVAPISGKLAADGVTPCFYNPVAGDRRFVRIQMTPAGDGITRTISPNMPIDSVPVATVAESLQGIIPSQLLQVNTSGANALSQANLESIFTGSNYSNLTAMMGTSSSNYVKNASNGSLGIPTFSGDPTAPTVGQVWYDSGSGVMKYYDGAVKTFGSVGAGITSLNGLSGAAQTFAVGTAGSDFNISSSGTVHTFNLPSSGAATRGLLSSADWTAFNSKMASNTVFAGDVSGTYNNITLNNTGVSAGNYTKINVDAKGRVVSGTNLTSADMTGALGYVPVNKAGDTMTGALVVSSSLQVNSNSTFNGSAAFNGTAAFTGVVSITNSATFSSGTTITSGLNVNAGALNVSGTQLLAGTKIGVGTNNPDASSILDLTSTTLGFLMPRMTTAQRNAVVAPATGLQVYNTDVNLVEFYNGASWVSMTTTATVPSAISNLNGLTGASQTFAVGSTGSDFNIVSSGTVHTYNIPNSSATARGLLSSADWSTFNNKLSTATAFGGDVSGTYNAITLNNTGVSAGIYTKVNVDAKGRVVSGTNLTSADITGTLGYTPVNKAGDTITGALVVSSSLQVNGTAAFNNAATFSSGTTITSGLNVNAGALNVSGTQLLAGTKIGVGTNNPDASSILDLTSTSLGFLMPRMTTAQRNAVAAPANGLQIYNLDSSTIEYYASGTWSSLGVAGAGLQSLNGLTSGTQTFATGATGSDFNIVSSGTVHTYNIPNSSATARGLLSSADWSTFNNKLSTATVFGGDVSGTYNAITLNNTGVSAGVYSRVNVDAKGRVVSGSTSLGLTSSDISNVAFVQGGNSFGASATIGTNDANSLQFVTSGSTKVTLLPSGNFGIGVDYPTRAILEVTGNVNGRPSAIFGANGAGMSIANDFPAIGFNSYWNGGTDLSLASGYGAAIGMNPGTGTIYFETSAGSAGGANAANPVSPALTILNNRNIGIGYFDPLNKFDVRGNMSIGNNFAGYYTAPANGLIVEGFVGIGTSNTQARLQIGEPGSVSGSVRIAASSTGFVDIRTPATVTSYYLTLPSTAGSNGQVLSTNGSGTLGWSSVPSNGGIFLASSGTAAAPGFAFSNDSNTGMYLAANDTLSFATSGTEVVRINSTGYVGIGVSAPTAPLHILHPGLTSAHFQHDDCGEFKIFQNSGGVGFHANAGNSCAPGDIGFSTGGGLGYAPTTGDTKLFIKQQGNVGVGTTNPLALLQVGEPGTVSGSVRIAASSTGYVDIRTPATVTSYAMTLPSTAGSSGQVLSTNGSGTLSWLSAPVNGGIFLASSGTAAAPGFAFSNDSNTGMYLIGNDTIGFATSGSEKVRITQDGHVQIGGDSSYSSYGKVIIGRLDTSEENGLYFLTPSIADAKIYMPGGTDGLRVWTQGTGDIVTFLNNGYMGIGSINPQELLQVGEPGSVNGVLRIAASTSGYVNIKTPNTVTSYNLTLPSTAGTNGQVLSTNGSGTLGWSSVPSNGGIFLASSGTAAAPGYAFSNDSNTGMYLAANDTLGFVTSGSQKVTVLPSGNVGIGTTNPVTPLHVSTDSFGNVELLSLANTNGGGNAVGMGFYVTGTKQSEIYAFDNNLTFNTSTGAGSMLWRTNGTDRMLLSSGGNFGIGTSNPLARLQVGEPGSVSGSIRIAASTTGYVDIRTPATVTSYNLTLPSTAGSNGQVLSTNGSGTLGWSSVPSNGGIFLASSGTAAAPGYAFSNDSNTGMYLEANDILTFATSGSEKMRISASGSVGVGTSSPVAMMHVQNPGTGVAMQLDTTLSSAPILKFDFSSGGSRIFATATSPVSYPASDGDLKLSVASSSNCTPGNACDIGGIIIKNTTANVGIGTTNPLARLQVGEPGSVSGSVRIAASSTGYVDIRTPATVTSYAMTLPSTAGSSGQVLSTNGSGTLGWTSVPSNGGIFLASSGTAAAPGYAFSNDTNTGMYLAANDTLAIVTSGTERIKVNGAGRIGIGADPSGSYDFYVAGVTNFASRVEVSDQISSTMAGDGSNVNSLVLFNNGQASQTGATILFESYNSGYSSLVDHAKISSIMVNNTPGSERGDLFFSTLKNGSTTEKMRLNSEGNLGVGTTSPLARLQVGEPGSVSGSVRIAASSTGYVDIRTPATVTSYAMTLPSTAGSSGQALTTNGSGTLGWTTIVGNGSTFLAANGTSATPSYSFSNDTNTGMYLLANDTLSFSTSGSDKVTILPSGNVGIGTTSPGSLLEISKNQDATTGIVLKNLSTGGSARAAYYGENNVGASFELGLMGGNANYSQLAANETYLNGSKMHFWANSGVGGYIRFSNGSDEMMRLDNYTGYVGIGTSTPDSKFHVRGASSDGTYVATFTTTNSAAEFIQGINSGTGQTAFQIRSDAGRPEMLFYDDSGITTAAIRTWPAAGPIFGAYANSSALGDGANNAYGAGLLIYHPDNATGENGIAFSDGNLAGESQVSHIGAAITGYDTEAGAFDRSGLKFKTNSGSGLQTRMTLINQGYVGIGTTSPSSTLDVNGAYTMRGITSATAGLSPATQGRIYFDSTANKFKVSENNGAYVNLVGGGGSGTVSGTANTIAMFTNSTTVGNSPMYVSGTNIGIGTTNPESELDIYAPDYAYIRFNRPDDNEAGIAFTENGVDDWSIFVDNSNPNPSQSGNLKIYNPQTGESDGDVRFRLPHDNRNLIFAESGGNIGVGGASSPATVMHIKRDQDALTELRLENASTGASAESVLNFYNNVGSMGWLWTAGSNFGQAHQRSRLMLSADANSNGLDLAATGAGDDIRFYTGGEAVNNERMRISGGGNIGIGTSATDANIRLVVTQEGGGVYPALKINTNTNTGDASLYFAGGTTDFTIGTDYSDSGKFKITNAANLGGLGNDRLVIDSVGNIGIGTTSPLARFQVGEPGTVSGSVRIAASSTGYVDIRTPATVTSYAMTLPSTAGSNGQALVTNGSGTLSWASVPSNGGIFLAGNGTSATPSYSFSNDTNTGMYLLSNDTLSFVTSGSNKVTISPTGNVGIGTTSPTAKLHLYDATNPSELIIESGEIGNTDVSKLSLMSRTNGVDGDLYGIISMGGSGTDGAEIRTSTVQAGVGGMETNLIFATDGETDNLQERMRITHNGLVGIGTNNPSDKLHVYGPSGYNYITAESGGNSGTDGAGFDAVRGGTSAWADISFYNTTTRAMSIGLKGGDTSNGLSFMDGDASNITRMFIEGTGGNVGIGSTNPLARLQVGEPGSVSGSVRIAASSTGYVDIRTPATVTSYAMTLPSTAGSSGQVLSTNGSGTLSWASVPSNGGTFLAANGTSSTPSYSFSNDTNTGMYLEANDTLSFSTSGSTKVTVMPSGRVGIGRTAPEETLDINGTLKLGSLVGWDGGQDIQIGGEALGSSMRFGSDTNDFLIGTTVATGAITSTIGDIQLRTGCCWNSHPAAAGTARLTVAAAGNIGIGNTNPQALLQVGDPGVVSGSVRIAASSTGYVDIRTPAIVTSYAMTLPSTAGSSGQALTTNGSGTLSWASVPSNGGIFLASSGTAAAPGYAFSNDSNTGMYLAAADNLAFATSGTEVGRIDSFGYFGLGTSSPNARIHSRVAGNNNTLELSAWDGASTNYSSLAVGHSSGGVTIYTGGSNGVPGDLNFSFGAFENTNSPSIVFKQSGNVGIGTTNPLARFQVGEPGTVSGSVRIAASSTGYVDIRTPATVTSYAMTLPSTAGSSGQALTTNGSGTLSWSTVVTSSTAFIQNGNSFGADTTLGTNDNNKLIFETNNTARFAIGGTADGGNVAIGSIYPSTLHQLFIDGWDADSNIGGSGSHISLREGANGSHRMNLGVKSGTSGYAWVQGVNGASSTTLPFVINGTGGNVGIGTTSPSQTLHVSGNGLIRSVANNANAFNVLNSAGTAILNVDTSTSTVSTGGAVWTGNSVFAPEKDASTPAYTFTNATNTGMFGVFPNVLGFSTSGTERMRIAPSGNVGIGTSAPAAKLEVIGSVSATSFAGSGASLTGMVTSQMPSAMKIRTCEIVIGDVSAAAPVLANDNDTPVVCANQTGSTMTIVSVECYADAGSPTVTPIITGGGATSILSGALTCGTGSFATGTLNGTPTQTDGQTIDGNITTAGGTAKYIVIRIKRSL